MRPGLPALITLLFMASITLSGCTSTPPQYLRNRGADLADVIQLHAIGSVGVAAKVEATRFLAIGAGVYKGYAAGLANRQVGAWEEAVVDLGVPPIMNVHVERISGADVPSISGSYHFALVNDPWPEYEHDAGIVSDWLTVRLTAVFFVGVDCEIRLNQLLDFVAGIVGSDTLSDDSPPESAWAV